MKPIVEDLKALKQLGMCCLVMTDTGEAFACENLLKINETGTAWKQASIFDPFASSLTPEKFNNYADHWKDSLIVIDDIVNILK